MARSGKYYIVLQWLNTLGGWEFWNFQARKTYGYNISNVQNIKRDIFQNWDVDFSAGLVQNEHLSLEAEEVIRVRTQNLTVQQMNAIAQIKFSIKVMDVTDPTRDIVVLVDKSSFQYRTDGEKITSLEFDITYPQKQIQSA